MADGLLKKTALNNWHREHGARMVSFAGWEMPVQYPTGPLTEHHATREHAGLFDIDHMGQLSIAGPDAEDFINYLISYDVTKLAMFQAHYAMLCYADGGVVDDLFVYKLPHHESETAAEYFLVVNAANLDKDALWLQAHQDIFDVTIVDVSPETYMMALQGPSAVKILNAVASIECEQCASFLGRPSYTYGAGAGPPGTHRLHRRRWFRVVLPQ